MPTYAYRCRDCGNQFDIFQKFADASLTVCPVCEGAIRRVIQPTGVVFKGTGFYINDSKNSSKGGSDKVKIAADASDSSSGDNAGADKTAKTAGADGSKDGKKDKGVGDKGAGDKAANEKPAASKSEQRSASGDKRAPAAARASDS